jgi:hypothetical protein
LTYFIVEIEERITIDICGNQFGPVKINNDVGTPSQLVAASVTLALNCQIAWMTRIMFRYTDYD